jgi:hypothetical protein
VAQFKRLIFPPVICFAFDETKRCTAWSLLSKLKSFSSQTGGFFQINQYLSNWAFHLTGLVLKFIEIWTCQICLASGSWNAYCGSKLQRCHFSEQTWKGLGKIQMMFCRDWWPCKKPRYITMIRRQSSNQLSNTIAAYLPPKISEWKNRLKTSRLGLLSSNRHPLPPVDYLPKFLILSQRTSCILEYSTSFPSSFATNF